MVGDLGWCCSCGSNNNWDLHAVVRLACSGSDHVVAPPQQSASDDSSGLPPPQPQSNHLMAAAAASVQPFLAGPAIEDLCLQAFFTSPKLETSQPSSPRNEAPVAEPQAKQRKSGGPARSRRKSKKSQASKVKEVTRAPVGGPPADLWAWRKYGQKPIKGSPYPRGYYRCSTDKDCKARKQVERCRADPGTLIVTYTGGDHGHPVPLHRNSLAGTTRNKAQPAVEEAPKAKAALSAASATDDTKSQGSPSRSTGLSASTPLRSPSVGLGLGVEYEGMELQGEDDMLLPHAR